jgi:glucoside 3-dehydrogenase (cytochrome c) hitch-hiker subunit
MSAYNPTFFSKDEYESIIEIIDIIIPATGTNSASQTNTQVFLDQVFSQCLTAEEQATLRTGLQKLIAGFEKAKDKLQYIREIDQKAYANDESMAYFKTLKQYTMIGFFTSQEGETKASHYVKSPGDYKGEIPLNHETLNYGKTFLHY